MLVRAIVENLGRELVLGKYNLRWIELHVHDGGKDLHS